MGGTFYTIIIDLIVMTLGSWLLIGFYPFSRKPKRNISFFLKFVKVYKYRKEPRIYKM